MVTPLNTFTSPRNLFSLRPPDMPPPIAGRDGHEAAGRGFAGGEEEAAGRTAGGNCKVFGEGLYCQQQKNF